MAKEHDNDVKLSLTGIKIKSFEVEDHSITNGQPYGGVTVPSGDTIRIKAGRHGSSTVADWFKKKASNGFVSGCDTYDKYPSELNFAVYGTLTFDFSGKTFVVKKMLLAQGHNARSRNNWWAGGPDMEGGNIGALISAAVAKAYVNKLPIATAKAGFIGKLTNDSTFDMAVVSL